MGRSSQITSVNGLRIWDSRGRPTIEVEVRLADGSIGRGLAPAGASRGTHEATDLRDGGDAFGGFGVDQALVHLRDTVAPALVGLDACDQAAIDARLIELDPSPTKARLGGNTVIACSMAVLWSAAAFARLPLWKHLAGERVVRLPLPEVQIFGGGAHAGRRVDIQDFLVMPVGASSFDEAICWVAEVYRAAGELMLLRGDRMGVADEGGWWPNFSSNEDALRVLTQAIDRAGFLDGRVMISLDIAASEFGRNGRYRLGLEERDFDTDGWLELLGSWVDRYPILSIEDPVAEDDTRGMAMFTRALDLDALAKEQ